MPGRPGEFCDFRGADGKAAPTNAGGGIAVGDNWTVRQVRFTNLEYFKIWAGDAVRNVRITDNRFDNWGGAESGDEDNVGGGSRNDGVVVEFNQFDRTIRGNSFDFTNAIRTTVRNNVVRSDGTIAAARKEKSLYGNMYFEGIQQAVVADNVLWGAQITLKTNGGYAHSGENRDITNPRDSVVSGNRISYSGETGISVNYDDYKDGSGVGRIGGWDDRSTDSDAFHYVRPGGNNVIRDNVIEYSGRSGILVNGSYAAAKNAADTISGNTVSNSGWGGSTVYDTGAGLFDTAGIGLSIEVGDQIYGNTIADDPARKTTWYGIDLGARRASTSPAGFTLTGPAGEVNTVANVIGTAYHDQTKLSEPVTESLFLSLPRLVRVSNLRLALWPGLDDAHLAIDGHGGFLALRTSRRAGSIAARRTNPYHHGRGGGQEREKERSDAGVLVSRAAALHREEDTDRDEPHHDADDHDPFDDFHSPNPQPGVLSPRPGFPVLGRGLNGLIGAALGVADGGSGNWIGGRNWNRMSSSVVRRSRRSRPGRLTRVDVSSSLPEPIMMAEASSTRATPNRQLNSVSSRGRPDAPLITSRSGTRPAVLATARRNGRMASSPPSPSTATNWRTRSRSSASIATNGSSVSSITYFERMVRLDPWPVCMASASRTSVWCVGSTGTRIRVGSFSGGATRSRRAR
jgi:hypothetical protein